MDNLSSSQRFFSYAYLPEYDSTYFESTNNFYGDQESTLTSHHLTSDNNYELPSDLNNNPIEYDILGNNKLSYSNEGIFCTLFDNDNLFIQKSETLKALAAEVQDIDSLSHNEKEMVINLFSKIQKSNIYKNVIRCFNRFMLKSNNQVTIECLDINNKSMSLIRKQYQKFLKNVTYSEMIVRIMKNERYSEFFKYYLKVHFLDDLRSGNFKQRKDHYLSSIFFLICFSDPSKITHIKFIKK